MNIGGREYTKDQALRRVGNIAQIGGTRHYTLSEGRSNGVRAVDFDTGSGFRFTVLPDRGMDISLAAYNGVSLAYLTPNGEVHPSYYEPEGLGWLRNFFGGLLTTCGLTYLGAPCKDGTDELGLHGRHSTSPACRVNDLSRWEGDDYILELTGVVEDAVLFGDKIRLTRTISTKIGSKSLAITDVAENFGYKTSPFTILYHINAGFPLLDETSKLALTAAETIPASDACDVSAMLRFSDPILGCEEQNFQHNMKTADDGNAHAAMLNHDLDGGLGLHIKFDTSTLPYLNEWKMMGEGDYVVGIEPCNAPCKGRDALREMGLLQFLEPGEKRTMRVEIEILDGQDDIAKFERSLI